MIVLVENRLVESTNTMSALTGRVEDTDKCINKLESIGNLDELRGETQTAMSSMVAIINREIQALRASEAAKGGELQALRLRCTRQRLRLWRHRSRCA